MPVLSRLLPTVTSAYALQTVCALVFVPLQEDRYFDLSGAIGFLSSTAISLYYPFIKANFLNGSSIPFPCLSTFAPRQLLLTAALGLWSARMGAFLASRALKAGGDTRFDETKKKPLRFTAVWMTQATWIVLVGLPVYLSNALPASLHPSLGLRDYAALGLFVGSFLFEIIADWQKTVWRQKKDRKEHDEKFITGGLWGISRHPNYVGELGLWTGIWALSTAALQTAYFPRGTVALGLVSPVFTYLLLTKVSGLPPLEKQAEKRYGGDPKYEEYRRNVPVLWPWGARG